MNQPAPGHFSSRPLTRCLLCFTEFMETLIERAVYLSLFPLAIAVIASESTGSGYKLKAFLLWLVIASVFELAWLYMLGSAIRF